MSDKLSKIIVDMAAGIETLTKVKEELKAQQTAKVDEDTVAQLKALVEKLEK